MALTNRDSEGFNVYTPSDVRDADGAVEGIREIFPDGTALDTATGLPSWRDSWAKDNKMFILPHTKGVHPNLSLAATNSNISTYGKGELRVFFWDKSGTKIRYTWWTKKEWSCAYPEKGWDVPVGAGKGMDAISWFDPLDGVHWSCFYCDAKGKLFELSCVSGSKGWSCKEVAVITADTHIQALVKWEQGKIDEN